MVAEIEDPGEKDSSNSSMEIDSDFDTENPKKAITVRVRVGGELVSEKSSSIDVKNFDQAMQQFLPRNEQGFQSELKFRQESNLSFLSGSLSAHEMCAVAAHRTRKEKMLKERRQHHKSHLIRDAAITCGKSIPIGTDTFGRSYWIFSAEPTSLFICETVTAPETAETSKKWHRFGKPEEIASVIVSLGKDAPCESLKETYPQAVALIKDRSWSTLLLRRMLPSEIATTATDAATAPTFTKQDKNEYGEVSALNDIALFHTLFQYI